MNREAIAEKLMVLRNAQLNLEAELAAVGEKIKAYEIVLADLNAAAHPSRVHSYAESLPHRHQMLMGKNKERYFAQPLRELIRNLVQQAGRIHHKEILNYLQTNKIPFDNPDTVRITCYQLGSDFETDRGFIQYIPAKRKEKL